MRAKSQALRVCSRMQCFTNDLRIFQFHVMFCIYLGELMRHTEVKEWIGSGSLAAQGETVHVQRGGTELKIKQNSVVITNTVRERV